MSLVFCCFEQYWYFSYIPPSQPDISGKAKEMQVLDNYDYGKTYKCCYDCEKTIRIKDSNSSYDSGSARKHTHLHIKQQCLGQQVEETVNVVPC